MQQTLLLRALLPERLFYWSVPQRAGTAGKGSTLHTERREPPRREPQLLESLKCWRTSTLSLSTAVGKEASEKKSRRFDWERIMPWPVSYRLSVRLSDSLGLRPRASPRASLRVSLKASDYAVPSAPLWRCSHFALATAWCKQQPGQQSIGSDSV